MRATIPFRVQLASNAGESSSPESSYSCATQQQRVRLYRGSIAHNSYHCYNVYNYIQLQHYYTTIGVHYHHNHCTCAVTHYTHIYIYYITHVP